MQVRVEEFIGESDQGWDEAVSSAVSQATQSLGQVTGVEVVNFTAKVENGKLASYRANCKIAAVK